MNRHLSIIVAVICLFVSSCSLTPWVRIFNRTDHAISVLEKTEGKMIVIPAGGSTRIGLLSVSRGKQYGFLINDDGKELFCAVLGTSNQSTETSWVLLLPKESQKRGFGGPEYFLEYADGSEIFALSPSKDGNPKRIEPQPSPFPIKLN